MGDAAGIDAGQTTLLSASGGLDSSDLMVSAERKTLICAYVAFGKEISFSDELLWLGAFGELLLHGPDELDDASITRATES